MDLKTAVSNYLTPDQRHAHTEARQALEAVWMADDDHFDQAVATFTEKRAVVLGLLKAQKEIK